MRSFSLSIAPKSCKEVSEAVYPRIHLWTDQIFAWHLATKEWKEWQVVRASSENWTIGSSAKAHRSFAYRKKRLPA